jgi:hypothetical protein
MRPLVQTSVPPKTEKKNNRCFSDVEREIVASD